MFFDGFPEELVDKPSEIKYFHTGANAIIADLKDTVSK